MTDVPSVCLPIYGGYGGAVSVTRLYCIGSLLGVNTTGTNSEYVRSTFLVVKATNTPVFGDATPCIVAEVQG
jgi:hypothetical protein